MKPFIREIEQATIGQLVRAMEGADAMAKLFAEEGAGADADNWKAVVGLIEQALHRFP